MEHDRSRNQATAGTVARDPELESASRIRDGLGIAEERLSDLHAVIDSVERRLDTVLSPVAPATAPPRNGAEVNTIGSHVTGRVQLLNEGFAHASARLRELTRRIEV